MLVALIGLVAGLRLHANVQDHQSPVDKVVTLIEDLKAKIDADGATEQKIYDKFACWCESTTQRKADAIDTGKETIGKTTTLILTLKGAIAVLASEIADLNADIAKNNKAMATLTSIREKENSDYMQEKAFTETALSSLHAAIEVLGGAGTGAMIQSSMNLLRVASDVRSAVLGSRQVAGLTKEQSKVLKHFLEDPSAFAAKPALVQDPVDYYDQKAQAKASYSPQSATIVGILKDMYDTFSADLEKSNQEESNMQLAFESEMAEKTKQNKQFTEMVTEKEGQKAEKGQMLSENEEKLEATTEQLKVDEEFFATAKESCTAKSDSWSERSRLRTEQLDGISKALAILTSDEAKATFSDATSTRPADTFGASEVASFVQLAEAGSPRERAYRVLKKLSKGTKNLRLARIAASVKTTAKGHFDEVIASIDDLISVLHAEGAQDIKQRDWCVDEQFKADNNRDDLADEISQLEAKILRGQETKAKLEADEAATQKAKDDLEAEMQQALDDRTAENGAYATAKSDDEKAIDLLGQAIEALSAYGENNAFLQRKQPEFEVSEDQAPDAEFSGKDNNAGAQSGIIQLLTQIKENLEGEIALADKSEAKATEEYEALRASADEQEAAYDRQLVALGESIASTDAQISADETTKTDTEGQHTAAIEYIDKIAPNCDWIKANFDARVAARTKETEGLEQAKSILSGSMGFTQMGLLQSVA
jgi:hypothetical protein